MRKVSVVGVFLGALSGFGIVACGDDETTVTPVETADDATGSPDAATGSSDATANDAGSKSDAADSGDAAPVDLAPPTVAILSPREDLAIAERRFVVTGTATDDIGVTGLSYVVGNKPAVTVPVDAEGKFTFTFEPTPGANSFEVTAVDASGKQTKATRSAYFGHRLSVGNSQSGMLANGKLFTWGRNELGQLANGTLVGTWSADEAVTPPAMYEQNAPNLVSIVTRQTFMIALASDGTVQTWGSNASGQLGYTTPSDCGSQGKSPCGRTPTTVAGITDAVAVAAGLEHSLVLRADGTVLAFGSNATGQLGLEGITSANTPTAVPGLTNVIALGAGTDHSMALTSDGKVLIWGSNEYGQLGTGSSDKVSHPVPTEVPNLVGASIAAGLRTNVVRKPDGSVVAWGQNNNGQVGNGTKTTVLSPAPVLVSVASEGVAPVALENIESIAADGFVSLALDRDGNAYAWGMGGLGQLGQGFLANGDRDLADRTVASPIYVPAADKPSFVILELEVGAGGPAFVRTTQGKLFGWGWSFQGSLGGGKTLLNAWAYSAPRLVFPLP